MKGSYEQGLLYRDGKQTEVLSSEESTKKAAKIFLKHALKGHKNAMHNYANIKYKQGEVELAYQFINFSKWLDCNLP
jgi:hypothetical protein